MMKLDRNKIFSFMLAAAFALTLAGCGGGGTATAPDDDGGTIVETPYSKAVEEIRAAETEADARAAYDAVKDDVTAAEGERLQAEVDARVAVLATMARANAQKMALADAAGMIDTSDLSTQAAINAAEAAIAVLKGAIAAAADVDDTSMYDAQVTAAETAVDNAQSALDHAAQTMALMNAVDGLQAIDLTDPVDAGEDRRRPGRHRRTSDGTG